MAIVPEPVVGSTKGLSGCQLVSKTNAAAKFSFNGAPPLLTRYPRLNNEGPVVSSVIIT